MSQPMYPQTPTWSADPPRPSPSYQWLAAGVAGIAGGFIVVSLVVGQVALLLSGRSGLAAEQGVLALAQLAFGVLVVAAAYQLAPGPLALRLIATAVFVVGLVLTVTLLTLRLTGALRGGPLSIYLVNPSGLVLLAGAAGWLLAAGARPLAYLTLLPTILVIAVPSLLVRAGLPSPLVSLATLGGALVVALLVLFAAKPSRS